MVNLLPIIGILCIDIDIDLDLTNCLKNNTFFISSSYVKGIESAGASIVPIWADRDEEYYRFIITKLNGILFSGGRIYLNDAKYDRTAFSAKQIYDIAVEMNNNGTLTAIPDCASKIYEIIQKLPESERPFLIDLPSCGCQQLLIVYGAHAEHSSTAQEHIRVARSSTATGPRRYSPRRPSPRRPNPRRPNPRRPSPRQ